LHLRLCIGQERGVLVQDEALQLLQLRRRLEAELVGQVGARLLVGAQRLRLPAAAVEGEHVLGAEAFADRVLLAEHFQLGDELGVVAEDQLGFDACLDGAQPQLLEAPRLELQRKRSRQVRVGMAAPERERGTQPLRRVGRIRLHELGRAGDRLLELDRIHVSRIGCQAIAAVVADDDVADRSAEVGDVRLQGRARRGRRLISPDAVDKRVDGDSLSHVGREQREHRPLLPPTEADLDAVAQDLERPQDMNVHACINIRPVAACA
jgi:hypothetical protein